MKQKIIMSSQLLLIVIRIVSPAFIQSSRIVSHSKRHCKKVKCNNIIGNVLFSTRNNDKSKTDEANETTLSWDNFDYSDLPKVDARFTSSISSSSSIESIQQCVSSQELDTIAKNEAKEDEKLSKQLQEKNSLALDSETVDKCIQTLRPYLQEKRVERLETILNQRTKNIRFLFENPSNPSNVWACLRTIESYGIQYVDIIIDSSVYKGKSALLQKRNIRTAMGSAKWMTLSTHTSTQSAVHDLRSKGYAIYASNLCESSIDIRDISWCTHTKSEQDKICIVMGNEERGISPTMKSLADASFILPMYGFAESYNLSVATAITLSYMNSSRDVADNLFQHNLDGEEKKYLMFKWMLDSLSQRKIGYLLLKKYCGVDLHKLKL